MAKIDPNGVMAAYVQKRFTSWHDSLRDKRAGWERFYKSWKCEEPDNEEDGDSSELSRLKMPDTKLAIDTAQDQIIELEFSRTPFFEVDGRELSDKLKARALQPYLMYLFDNEDFFGKYEALSLERFICGTAIAMISTDTQLRETEQIVEGEIDDDGNREADSVVLEQKEVLTPSTNHISLFDFAIDPESRTFDDGEGVAFRSFKSIQALRKLQRLGVIENTDEIESLSGGEISDERRAALTSMGIMISEDLNKLPVIEYWGWVDEKTLTDAGIDVDTEDGGAEMRVVVCYDTTLLCVKNPHMSQRRPFVKLVCQQIPGEFWGLGIAEAAESPQRALDSTVRARMDSLGFTNFPEFGIDFRKLHPGQDLKRYPGKVWLVQGNVNEAISQLRTQDLGLSTVQAIQEYKSQIQDASGISRLLGGMPAKRGEQSATETSLLNQHSSVRLKHIARSDENGFLKKLLRWYYHIVIQFLDERELVRVSGENGASPLAEISAESLVGNYDFVPKGVVEISGRSELERLIQVLQATSNPVDQQIVNRVYLIRKIYQRMFPHETDVDEMISVPQTQQSAVQNAKGVPGSGSVARVREQGGINAGL